MVILRYVNIVCRAILIFRFIDVASQLQRSFLTYEMSRQGMNQYSAWPYYFLAFPCFPVSVNFIVWMHGFFSLFPSRNLSYYLGMHLKMAHGLIEFLYLGTIGVRILMGLTVYGRPIVITSVLSDPM
jgi:hypothetical protein